MELNDIYRTKYKSSISFRLIINAIFIKRNNGLLDSEKAIGLGGNERGYLFILLMGSYITCPE